MSNNYEIFQAIQKGNSEKVRELLLQNPSLITLTQRFPHLTFDKNVERDAYKFLGAYLGSLSPLHLAILLGQDEIAKDIIERTSNMDLNLTFGCQNTALHLSTFLGDQQVTKLLLQRGANAHLMNGKGFTSLDVSDDPEMNSLYSLECE